jgi:PAS domain S-box-containing protein
MDDRERSKEDILKELNALRVRLAEAEVQDLELVRTRQKLQALEQLVDTMSLGVTISDIEGRILYSNPAEAQMHGYQVKELIGQEVRIFAPNGLWNPMTKEQARKIKRLSREGLNVRKDGTVFPVHLVSDVVKNSSGEPIAIITTSEEMTAQKQAQAMQSALYKISHKANAAQNPEQLFSDIHSILGGLMYARNFLVALYDDDTQILEFPHHIDEFSATPPPAKLGKGLFEYVIKSGQVLFASSETIAEKMRAGEMDEMTTPFVNWLGVPLKKGDKTVGIMVIKSYTEEISFSDSEKDLLIFVAQQIVGALERLKK